MCLRRFFCAFLFALSLTCPAHAAPAAVPTPAAFGVAAHPDVNIEWWYVNAHVTTNKGRHLALIGSFFQFGAGLSASGLGPPFPAHYLIYAVTDLDKRTQRSYSLADRTMHLWAAQLAYITAASHPHDKAAQRLAALLTGEHLPPPHQIMAGGTATVTNSPFRLEYGSAGEAQNSLTSLNAANTAFDLHLGGARKEITDKTLAGQDEIRLTLTSQKPPMAVGGKGETGLKRSNDMYYFSLTRCAVGGTIDTGAGPETITGGQGWFDHQWGNSWVASNNGWDWWGVQLDDGTDILFFHADPQALWKSPKSGVTYPLGWEVTFPEKNLALYITAEVKDQEMPILGPGGNIWEGLCRVEAFHFPQIAASHRKKGLTKFVIELPDKPAGVAYMELVGYGSPTVKKQVRKGK